MTLLRDIQAAAADDSISAASLLRKCQILAGRLGNVEFSTWVQHELMGYPADAELPAYRTRVRGQLRGTLANAARWYKNAALPETSLPEEYREQLLFAELRQPVAEIELLSKANDPRSPVPPELWEPMEQHYGGGYQLLQAEVSFGRGAFVAALDAVRTKALAFAIEIEGLDSAAGEGSPRDASRDRLGRHSTRL